MDRNSRIRRLVRTYDPADVPTTARPERFAYRDAGELAWVVEPPTLQKRKVVSVKRHRRHDPGSAAASGF